MLGYLFTGYQNDTAADGMGNYTIFDALVAKKQSNGSSRLFTDSCPGLFSLESDINQS